MSRLPTGLPSKNATIRRPPLTPQSPRRSPNCRLHSPCRSPSKARGLWHDTNTSHSRPPYKRIMLPLHYPRTMGRHYNRLNLPPPSRLKVYNRLLISKPHRTSCRRNSYPNPLRLYRRNYSHNRPRSNILRLILPSKY